MPKQFLHMLIVTSIILCCALSIGCVADWPASPLYEPPENDPGWIPPATEAEAMDAIEGLYAHYDIVAYLSDSPGGPMRTFIISYGFTEFGSDGCNLVEFDRFCHAEQISNQPFVSTFSDEATQAIQPRSAVVALSQEDGAWTKLERPFTPTLIGIQGDPDAPIPTTREDYDAQSDYTMFDDDNDGNPGVTVGIVLYGFIKGEIYIARREIFRSNLTLYSNGELFGNVVDQSEQLVYDASLEILKGSNNPDQYVGDGPDYGLNPVILVPVSDEIDTCEELMANRDDYFPPEPTF